MLSTCLLEGDIDQIRPRLKTEEPKDPYPGYTLIPVSDLIYFPNPASGPVTIWNYTGPGDGNIRIPAAIGGYPVVAIDWVGSGRGAFGLLNITGVAIPNSIKTIGRRAFGDNYELTSVTIPSGVEIIESSAFENCTQLTSVTFSNTVTSIGGSSFFNCNLASVTIPSSVQTIGNQAFSTNPLTSVTFLGSTTTIEQPLLDFNGVYDGNLVSLYASPPPVGGAGTYTRPDETSTVWTKVN